jgi:hypothetical protein
MVIYYLTERTTMLGTYDDVQKLSTYNIGAALKSFGALSRGTQAIATEITDYSRRSFENGSKAMEKLLGVKSLDKAIEVQSEYARAIYEDYTAEVTKLGALYTDLAKEVFRPYEGLARQTSSAK